MSLRHRFAAVVVGALAFIAAYPPFDLAAVAWIATAPLAAALLAPGLSVGAASLLGLSFGWMASLGIVGPWMTTAAIDYFDRSAPFAFGFTLLMTALNVAIYYAATFACIVPLSRFGPAARVIGFATLWSAGEVVRSWTAYGNAWALLGHPIATVPSWAQAAALGGMPLLATLAAASGAALAVAFAARGRVRVKYLTVAASLPLLVALAGQAGAPTTDPADTLRVGIVQADIGRQALWDPSLRFRHLERHIELSRSPELSDAQLIVWPENAVPFVLDADPTVVGRLQSLAEELDAALLVGGSRSEQRQLGRAEIHNSAYLFEPGTEDYRSYDKRRLLPFVESIPRWARWLTGSTWPGAYSPGRGERVFDIGDWTVAPLICFEAIYPDAAAAAARDGADLLVNLSNDSWFDGGAGPEQHFAMAASRAVETRRPLVRAANSGLSAAVAADGTVTATLPSRTEAVATVLVERSRNDSFYSRSVQGWNWAVCLAAAAFVVAALLRRLDRPEAG